MGKAARETSWSLLMKQAIILLQLTPADLAALDQLEGMTALPAMRLKMTTLSRVYDRGCTVEFLMWPYGSWSSLNAFNLKRFAFLDHYLGFR